MDIRSYLATHTYASTRSATEPQASPNGPSVWDAFGEAARNFTETLKTGEDTAKAVMTGNADPHALVTALAQTELAIETAVTVRDRVVEAYQEILRMPV